MTAKTTPTSLIPTAARGEATITLNGQPHPVRFSLNVLRDYTQSIGRRLREVGLLFADDIVETTIHLVAHAVRRYVPGQQDFSLENSADLMEEMGQAEAEKIAGAILEAIKVGESPLVAALLEKSPKPAAPTTGADSEILPSEN